MTKSDAEWRELAVLLLRGQVAQEDVSDVARELARLHRKARREEAKEAREEEATRLRYEARQAQLHRQRAEWPTGDAMHWSPE